MPVISPIKHSTKIWFGIAEVVCLKCFKSVIPISAVQLDSVKAFCKPSMLLFFISANIQDPFHLVILGGGQLTNESDEEYLTTNENTST